jgi:hypothetical protein
VKNEGNEKKGFGTKHEPALFTTVKPLEIKRSGPMFDTLIKKLSGELSKSETARSNRRRYRPGVEGLEGRFSLSTIPGSTVTVTPGMPGLSPTPTQWSHP